MRKTVTVLFMDLVGSTAFGEQVDPELAREAMAEYHDMAGATIELHGGTVAKFIGDGVMALFGVPEMGEDDAGRAVAAGVDLQRRFETMQRRLADRFGADVGMRVGINTGEIAVADDDADVVGDALNTAARLEEECPPGEVVVGEETWRLTRSRFEYVRLGEINVRGRRAAVAAFRVEERDTDLVEPPTPFVGRDAELGELRALFDEVVSGRRTRVATVVGAPGVGKSRLAREFARRIGPEAQIMYLQCEQSGASTYAPIAELLRSTARIEDGQGPAEIVEHIRSLVGESRDAVRVSELLAGLVGVGPARSTDESFYAIRRLAEIHAAQRPLVLVVDDMQWAGPVLFDLLGHLVRWVAAPMLVVALARPELREVRPALTEPGRHVRLVIGLEGLDPAATTELATLLLGAKPLPTELTARLPLSTDGNPLFVRELVRMLADDGVLTEGEHGWELAIDVDAIDVPPTIQSLLSTRIERLPRGDRNIVELAAVVGVEFPLGALAAIADDWTRPELELSLERLGRREQILPTGTLWGDEPVYRFHHVLVRDAAYRRLLKQTRATLHVRVATWLEDAAQGPLGEDDVTIAHHYELAHRYQGEIGLDAGSGAGRDAARLFRRAAAAALASDDLVTAGELAQRGATCLTVARRADRRHAARDVDRHVDHHVDRDVDRHVDRDVDHHVDRDVDHHVDRDVDRHVDRHDDRDDGGPLDGPADDLPELLILACEALLSAGDVRNGSQVVERLCTVAGDDDRLLAWATCFRGQLTVLTDPNGLRDAADDVGRAAERLAELGDHAGVAKARLVRAEAVARLGEVARCEVELDRALTAARTAGDDRRITAVLGAAPLAALWGPSPVPRAGGRCLDVMRLSRITSDSPSVEATAVRCQAVLEAFRGNHDTARTLLDSARTIGRRVGLRHGLLETDLYCGIVDLLADRPADAEPHLRRAHAGLGQLQIGADAGQAAAYLARALLLQGRLDEAEELALDSDALAGQNPQTAIAARSALAEILAARGDHERAVRLAEEALRIAAPTDIVVDHANALMTLARVRDVAGDVHGRGIAAASAYRLYESKGATAAMAAAAAMAGALLDEATWTGDRAVDDRAGPVDTVENRAVVHLRRLVRHWGADDRASAAALLGRGVTVRDHRTAVASAPPAARPATAPGVLPPLLSPPPPGGAGDVAADLLVISAHADALAFGVIDARVDGEGRTAAATTLVVGRWDHTSAAFDHISLYDPADLRAAADEVDDLLVGIDPSPPVATSLAVLRAHRHADADALERLTSSDFAVVDRREIGFGHIERRAWIDIHRRAVPGDEVTGVLVSPRLHRATEAGWVAHAVSWTGPEPDHLNLSVLTISVGLLDADGLLCRLEFHPDDGLEAALARLEQHARTRRRRSGADHPDGPAASAVLDATNQVAAAISRRDATAFRASWSRNLRFVDHRTIGWDSGGFDRMIERFRSLNPEDGTNTDDVLAEVVEVHRLDPPVLCHTGSHTLTTPAGARLTECHVIVSRIDPATGQIDRLDEYPDDRLDEALERAAELAEQSDRSGCNDAVYVGGIANRRAHSGDVQAWAALCSHDYRLVPSGAAGEPVEPDPVDLTAGSPRPASRADLLTGAVALTEAGFGVDDRRVRDVHGAHAALVELRSLTHEAHRHDSHRDDASSVDLQPDDTVAAGSAAGGRPAAHLRQPGSDGHRLDVVGYVVDEIDDAGRLVCTTRFGPHEMAAARRRLDQLALGGPTLDRSTTDRRSDEPV